MHVQFPKSSGFLLRRVIPPHFTRILGVFPWTRLPMTDVVASRSEDPKLIIRVITFELVQPICPRYLNVTDRQTEGQTDGRTTYDSNTALALRASRGKNGHLQKIFWGCLFTVLPHLSPTPLTLSFSHLSCLSNLLPFTVILSPSPPQNGH